MSFLSKIFPACSLALLLGAAVAGSAHADIETYAADLAGSNEVPAVATAATGAAAIVVDTESLEAFWGLEFTGLSSAQTGAHFHNAPAGANGGVVQALPSGASVNGVWIMTPAQYGMLAGGDIYANVHSQNFPGGEIRGQMTLISAVPAGDVSFGAVKALFR